MTNGDPTLVTEHKTFADQMTEHSCRWCDTNLKDQPIHYYPHSAGWKVKGFKERLWLYIVCPKCRYQWALWKLGVKRD